MASHSLNARSEMRNSVWFVENDFTIVGMHDDRIKAIYNYRNEIAVVCAHRIEIWDLSARALKETFPVPVCRDVELASVKFDDSIILVSNDTGQIMAWKRSPRRFITTFEGINISLNSYDFNELCNIVVGSFVRDGIRIWNLSTGKQVKYIEYQDLIKKLKVVLYHSEQFNTSGVNSSYHWGNFNLFSMSLHDIFMWKIEFDTSTDGIVSMYPRVRVMNFSNISCSFSRRIFGNLVCCGAALYFPNSSPSEPNDAILEWNSDLREVVRMLRVTEGVKYLLADGVKYIAFHTTGHSGFSEKVLIVEKKSGTVVATYIVPEDITDLYSGESLDIFPLIFGDEKCLDGIHGTNNDEGVLYAYMTKQNSVKFINWKLRN